MLESPGNSDSIFAEFTPSSHLRKHSSPLINKTNTKLTTLLLKSFPLIIIANSSMDLILWTSREPFLNFFYNCLLYLFIYYYDVSIYYFYLPFVMVLIYCSINYYVNSVYMDINSGDSPTLEEIVDNLENFNIRMEMVLQPFKSIELSKTKLANLIFILTPFHILIMHYVVRTKVFLLVTVIVITTFHSLWFKATIKILWRSQMIRNIFHFFIGVTLVNSSNYNNYKILTESSLPENKSGKIIQFQILEHQRRWIGIGWSDKLLPYERSNFTNEVLQSSVSPLNFKFPFNSKHWQWLEENWSVDLTFYNKKNSGGWVYFDNYWLDGRHSDSATVYTRSRRWVRKAVFITDKHE